ncbi:MULTISPECIES: DUF1820 family protein [Oceanospirillaceae]|jgi:hypothetical protein|uniref:DUF1820 family protein n=1 Tax=Oceanospirillaceae TaxID=135620 RepID=UPI000C56ADCB|nr:MULTISPECIES: DUF1820 family protein [Thalassolituus]MAY13971.1 hypothetical protein [Oceanospirillaceae bacterium]MBU2039503.1 DUF1820 family protein [Gammaproteobacteria bacterium]MCB2386956.1 DUF1820 family protein [Thalassolituus alkanivorans]MCB2423486.1 DUF1820 family protein [Thalassolituus alkanivorans]TVV42479.1 DUF1820 family protein [Thalassolituus sp. C2-1]
MSSKDKQEPTYRIVYQQQGDVVEIYARYIYQSDLHGFIEVEQLLFGERSSLVVDPDAEKLKATFADVKRTFIPMHSIVRIDEVEKEGSPKISKGEGSNISHFPTRFLPPRDEDE